MNIKGPIYITLLVFVTFVVGLGTGSFLTQQPKTQTKDTQEITEFHKNGKLTSPLLECNIPSSIGGKEFLTFENKLRAHINSLQTQGKITHASVYFRHLLDGAWIGINETETFTPASLLKVPNMIALFKEAETDPTLLTKKLVYTQKYFEGIPNYPASKTLELNASYTVEDLVERMVKYSDNESMFLLRANFDSSLFDRLYKDLTIAAPDDNVSDDFMTVKTYASFFRILFNASYLSAPMSEKALNILANSEFKKGLVAGIPENIVVAHKFGERTYTDSDIKQLHDCGIVYNTDDPYLLCIMTRGTNFDTLSEVIQSISKSVWDEMQERINAKKQQSTNALCAS
jgi:beta-lactamase class A